MDPAADQRFPAAIRDLWPALTREVVLLHERWKVYLQLYGTSQEQVDVLNRSAALFFALLYEVMLTEMHMVFGRLGDPAFTVRKKAPRENCSLAALEARLRTASEVAVADKLTPLIDAYRAACVGIRLRRNQQMAHLDVATLKDAKVQGVKRPSRPEIEAALEALRAAMHYVEGHYADTTTSFGIYSTRDGNALLATLKLGLDYKRLVDAKVIPAEEYLRALRRSNPA